MASSGGASTGLIVPHGAFLYVPPRPCPASSVFIDPEEARAEAHLRIAGCLRPTLRQRNERRRSSRSSTSLTAADPSSTHRTNARKVAELNLIAGRRAKASSATPRADVSHRLARRCCGTTRGSAVRTSPSRWSCTGPTVSSGRARCRPWRSVWRRLQRALSTRSNERRRKPACGSVTRCSGRATARLRWASNSSGTWASTGRPIPPRWSASRV